ncbi:hypothetical protein CLAUDI_27 [Bacillus phage Claudi]|uniref:Uncharacterized protein n=1 Tax=Bacillus phage Claudi TaxID=1874001 RepID=A0A1B1PAJ4_9CAUD|nr:hypothetical protein MUK67_gp27 [Bacillus phage Claudi]ANT41181.1 hypothetical protein CLAUDI_27 [Bacillus phage Claudi]
MGHQSDHQKKNVVFVLSGGLKMGSMLIIPIYFCLFFTMVLCFKIYDLWRS